MNIYSKLIPEALGITKICVAERTHRVGKQKEEHTSPRPVIVCFLNYTDKVAILQSYRKTKPLSLYGHKLLLFAEYLVEGTC